MNLPAPIIPTNNATNLLEELERQDNFALVEGDSLTLQECSGDRLNNTEVLINGSLFGFFMHHKNGRILCYEASIDNTEEGITKETPPDKYLEWAENGSILISSQSLKGLLNIEQAKELVTYYHNNALI